MSNVVVVSTELGMVSMAPISLPDLTDLLCSAITAATQQVVVTLPAAEKDKITQELFDCMNNSFSKCLENAFPEFTLRGDLTEEAILKAENEILLDTAKNVKAFKPKKKKV